MHTHGLCFLPRLFSQFSAAAAPCCAISSSSSSPLYAGPPRPRSSARRLSDQPGARVDGQHAAVEVGGHQPAATGLRIEVGRRDLDAERGQHLAAEATIERSAAEGF